MQHSLQQFAFKNVLLFCPEVKTGGPEAMHQLACEINRQGGTARMAYYGPYSRLEIHGDTIRCIANNSPMPDHFQQYCPQVLQDAKLEPDTLIVYPEVTLNLAVAPPFLNFRRAIWWLSVDNAMLKNPHLLKEEYRKLLFTNPDLIHFYQSEYAHAFLKNAGASTCHALSDYTDPQFIRHSLDASGNPPILNRTNKICFFPQKGAALAKDFITHGALRHRIDLVPIHNMTKDQVRETLFSARIYIDFGHHPGKDRVPREAAIAGAIVLVHAAGAANHFADYPLAPEYRFTSGDIASGNLHNRIDMILDNPESHFMAQESYRQGIQREQEQFSLEVRSAFFRNAEEAVA